MLKVIWLIFIKVMVRMTGLKMGWWNKVFIEKEVIVVAAELEKQVWFTQWRKSAVSDTPFPPMKEKKLVPLPRRALWNIGPKPAHGGEG